MNNTEAKAKKWLAYSYGLGEHEVVYSSSLYFPDFTLPDGKTFEVKRLYGDKIIVYTSQIEMLRVYENTRVLVFAEPVSPIANVSGKQLVEAVDNETNLAGNIKITIAWEGRYQIQLDPETNELLKTYKRTFVPTGEYTDIIKEVLRHFLEEILKYEEAPSK